MWWSEILHHAASGNKKSFDLYHFFMRQSGQRGIPEAIQIQRAPVPA